MIESNAGGESFVTRMCLYTLWHKQLHSWEQASSLVLYMCCLLLAHLPAEELEARHVAIGMAIFNAIGSSGGFVGPYLTAAVVQRMGSFVQATLIQGSFLLASGVLATGLGVWERLQKRKEQQALGAAHRQ